jgi:hypothetical protein
MVGGSRERGVGSMPVKIVYLDGGVIDQLILSGRFREIFDLYQSQGVKFVTSDTIWNGELEALRGIGLR